MKSAKYWLDGAPLSRKAVRLLENHIRLVQLDAWRQGMFDASEVQLKVRLFKRGNESALTFAKRALEAKRDAVLDEFSRGTIETVCRKKLPPYLTHKTN